MISKVNKNVCVPNVYKLYGKDRRFLREVRIETPDYRVVSLYREGDTYYVRQGSWRLYETECFDGSTTAGTVD